MYVNTKLIDYIISTECSYKEVAQLYNISLSSVERMVRLLKDVDSNRYSRLKEIMADRKKRLVLENLKRCNEMVRKKI